MIGVVHGDDLMPRLDELLGKGHDLTHLDTGQPLSSIRDRVVSANVYLGARPIAMALRGGASVVITGRVADASLTLGPAVHELGWDWHDWDRLAAGTVAGHLIECGANAARRSLAGTPISGTAETSPKSATPSPKSNPAAPARSPNHPRPAAWSIASPSASNSSTKSVIRSITSRPMSIAISPR
jgi:hypothetical protein